MAAIMKRRLRSTERRRSSAETGSPARYISTRSVIATYTSSMSRGSRASAQAASSASSVRPTRPPSVPVAGLGWCFWLVLLASASGWCFWLVLRPVPERPAILPPAVCPGQAL